MSTTSTGALVLLLGLLGLSVEAFAEPKCEADTFTGEQSCVYGTGTLGIAGIGNQMITADGQMIYVKMFTRRGSPVRTEAMLFRLDGRNTLRVAATEASKPSVNCRGGGGCTWMWNVAVPMSAAVLSEIAAAKELVVAVEGHGERSEPQTMKRGGQLFAKLHADIQLHESNVLATSKAQAFVQEGNTLTPYGAHPDEPSVGHPVEGHALPPTDVPGQSPPASVSDQAPQRPQSWWGRQKGG